MKNAKPINENLVLVVDDDQHARQSLAALLALKGYSVLEAANGQMALEVLTKTPTSPCVILLDLAMPVLDGRGFLKYRAADPALSQIPVAVVSASPPPVVLLNGLDTFLRKPIGFDRLIAVIEHHC
jgi:two-component system, chemotaxis family, chemotaxis protein CheY